MARDAPELRKDAEIDEGHEPTMPEVLALLPPRHRRFLIERQLSRAAAADSDEPLWHDVFMLLPPRARVRLLDEVVRLSRKAAAFERMAAELREELARARPPSPKERLDARDEAIREALLLYDGPPTVRAKKLARDLLRPASNASAQRRAAAEVLRLNRGRPIGWRQLHDIGAGYR
ncbi:MAG: hypothetical protein EKK29_05810 [Hyphomicrobiales bacterium]|nr:MAG: hypothetical protein EKK29_05810 [Hyphomicrobiales bacterium]